MLKNLTPIFLEAALAFVSFMAFAIEVPDYGSKNFSPIGDTPTYLTNESIPLSTKTADTTPGDSTAQDAAAPMSCIAAAVPSAHRNAGRHDLQSGANDRFLVNPTIPRRAANGA